MRSNTVALCALTLMIGCAPIDQAPAESPKQKDGYASETPNGAIPVGNDIFMVPVGEDPTGCTQYTARSEVHAVLTVIQYRRPDGSFSALREEADCPPMS